MPAHNTKSHLQQYNARSPASAGGPPDVLTLDLVDLTLNSIIIQDEAFFNGNFFAVGIISTGDISSLTAIKSSSAVSGVGYEVGAGGSVTQGTNKATGVSLARMCGAITMHNAALGAGASVSFTLTNTSIGINDSIIVNVRSPAPGPGLAIYQVSIAAVAAGSCVIQLTNISLGSLSDAVVVNFAVIKGVVA